MPQGHRRSKLNHRVIMRFTYGILRARARCSAPSSMIAASTRKRLSCAGTTMFATKATAESTGARIAATSAQRSGTNAMISPRQRSRSGSTRPSRPAGLSHDLNNSGIRDQGRGRAGKTLPPGDAFVSNRSPAARGRRIVAAAPVDTLMEPVRASARSLRSVVVVYRVA